MPEFTIVPLKEAQVSTLPGRQGKLLTQYVPYIQQLPQGQAGKLQSVGNGDPATIRRQLTQAAHALGVHLIIKRSGSDVYFWTEAGGEKQPRRKRSYTRRMKSQEEMPGTGQSFSDREAVEERVSTG
jgi:hypothetical protein